MNQGAYGKALADRIQGRGRTPLSRFYFTELDKNFSQFLPDKKDASLVEIGPGTGTFVEYLLQKGYSNVQASEMSTDLRESLLQTFGPSVSLLPFRLETFIEDALKHKKKYDGIFMIHVIEHCTQEEIDLLFSSLPKILKKGGVLVLETPNMWNLFFGSYFSFIDITHTFHFTPRSLYQAFLMNAATKTNVFQVHRRVYLSVIDIVRTSFQQEKVVDSASKAQTNASPLPQKMLNKLLKYITTSVLYFFSEICSRTMYGLLDHDSSVALDVYSPQFIVSVRNQKNS